MYILFVLALFREIHIEDEIWGFVANSKDDYSSTGSH